MSERKREDARGRFRVGQITDEWMKILHVNEGDIIVAPDGFPSGVERPDAPKVEREVRSVFPVHHNAAYYLGELYEKGVLEPVDD